MTDPFGGGFDPRMFENVPLFRELAKMMSWTGGPVNWELALQTADAVLEPGPAELPSGGIGFTAAPASGADRAFIDAVSTAELWLDQATSLPAVTGRVLALSERQWARLACRSEGLGIYVEPVAEGMGDAVLGQLPEEMAPAMGQMRQPLQAMGAMLYGTQIGTVAGHLGSQLLGTYDLGLPTIDPSTIGTVGSTAERFAAEYDFDITEFRHWLALREAAHRRQFAGVPWLVDHLGGLIREFAAGAAFDPSQLMGQLGGMGIDPAQLMGDPDALREAMEADDGFEIEPTAEQRAVLDRLQALVAFTEGWVDRAVAAVAGDKLTALPRIDEAIRRRRAERGPGERFLAQLIGLDVRPADVRAGQAFCDAVVAARGTEGLDRVWRASEHLPTPAELADPSRWLVRMAAVEIAADLDGDDDPR